jgi:hypothetical protein
VYLRRLVRGAVNAINHDQQIGWLKSTGSTRDPVTGIVTPTYAALQLPWAQIQPVPTDKLAHLDQLNIQGVMRSVYLKDAVATAVRADGTGGDLLQFAELPGGQLRTWLVELVDEVWGNSEWCHAICTLQNDVNFAQIVDVLATGTGLLIGTGPGQPIQVNQTDGT